MDEEILEKVKAIIAGETSVRAEDILWESDLVELTERPTGASCCKRG